MVTTAPAMRVTSLRYLGGWMNGVWVEEDRWGGEGGIHVLDQLYVGNGDSGACYVNHFPWLNECVSGLVNGLMNMGSRR